MFCYVEIVHPVSTLYMFCCFAFKGKSRTSCTQSGADFSLQCARSMSMLENFSTLFFHYPSVHVLPWAQSY